MLVAADKKKTHGIGSSGRVGHLRRDRRPGQVRDVPRAGRPRRTRDPRRPRDRGREEWLGPATVPGLRHAASPDRRRHRPRTVRGLPGGRGRRPHLHRGDLRRDPARPRILAMGRRPPPHPCRKGPAGHRHRGQHPVQARPPRRVRLDASRSPTRSDSGSGPRPRPASPSPERSRAPATKRCCTNFRSPSTRGPTCVPPTG